MFIVVIMYSVIGVYEQIRSELFRSKVGTSFVKKTGPILLSEYKFTHDINTSVRICKRNIIKDIVSKYDH